MLEECVGQLDEPFRRSEIIGWFRRHYPQVKESTLAAHIQAATSNATNRAQNHPYHGQQSPLLRRIDHGLYVRAGQPLGQPQAPALVDLPERVTRRGPASDVILIGCVRTKRATASAAADLFVSPLFVGRHRFAMASGLPWYILSAKFGLLASDDVIGPYDVYLADQSLSYKRAWGEFVAAQLDRLEPNLLDRTVEVHAGAAYVDPLRAPLAARGAKLVTPLARLRQGEQLAWYMSNAPTSPTPVTPISVRRQADTTGADIQELVRSLSDRSRALSPQELLGRGPTSLQSPGLYTWWVDDRGSAELSQGLGQPVSPGLIYGGQAGATRWPSGKSSTNTLWGRIAKMHLGNVSDFSTFRRTLAAILGPLLGLNGEDDPGLLDWIKMHLSVIAVPVPDADRLGQIESEVLDLLDPPLNLRGRQPNAIRQRLSELRRSNRQV